MELLDGLGAKSAGGDMDSPDRWSCGASWFYVTEPARARSDRSTSLIYGIFSQRSRIHIGGLWRPNRKMDAERCRASVDVKFPENHGGNSEVRWLDNLLYLYTKPFDIVVDTFASGETVS